MAKLKTSEVIGQLDKVSGEVAANRQRLAEAKAAVDARVVNLNDIPNRYADLLETINDVAYGADAHETANKATMDALTAEFQALVAEATTVRDWLAANVTEF